MELNGAKVLVTGATGGIGQALATAFAARGAELLLTGRRADALEEVAQAAGGRAVPTDLSDRSAVRQLMEASGEIDILVANAALPGTGSLDDYAIDEVDRTLDVNLRVPIVMAKLASASMVARRRGHLVFVSSLSGKTASRYASLYNATKFGLRGFALGLREDLRPHGVGVSTVFPGYISQAGMFADSGARLPAGVGTRSPQDVAQATLGAIDKNLAEVDVAPPSARLIALLGGAAPSVAAAIQRRVGADRTTEQLATGLRHKR